MSDDREVIADRLKEFFRRDGAMEAFSAAPSRFDEPRANETLALVQDGPGMRGDRSARMVFAGGDVRVVVDVVRRGRVSNLAGAITEAGGAMTVSRPGNAPPRSVFFDESLRFELEVDAGPVRFTLTSPSGHRASTPWVAV